jgi:hypothetical protein
MEQQVHIKTWYKKDNLVIFTGNLWSHAFLTVANWFLVTIFFLNRSVINEDY